MHFSYLFLFYTFGKINLIFNQYNIFFANCIKIDSSHTSPGHFISLTGKCRCGRPLKCLRAFRHVIRWVELLYRFSKRLDFDLNRRTLNSIHQTDFWRFQPGVHFNWINFPWSINPEIETIKMGGLWIITGSTHIFHETLMRTYWNKRLLVASELFEPKKMITFSHAI